MGKERQLDVLHFHAHPREDLQRFPKDAPRRFGTARAGTRGDGHQAASRASNPDRSGTRTGDRRSRGPAGPGRRSPPAHGRSPRRTGPTGPILSRLQESAMQPNRLTRPKVGRSPEAPHRPRPERRWSLRSRCRSPKPIRPATAAEDRPRWRIRSWCGPVSRGLSAELVFAAGELSQRVLGHEHRPGGFEPLDDRRVPVGHPVTKDARAPGGADAAGVEEILHPVGGCRGGCCAGRRRPARGRRVRRLRGAWSRAIVTMVASLPWWSLAGLAGELEGRRVQGVGAVEVGPREFGGGERAVPEAGRQLRDRAEEGRFVHGHGQPRWKIVRGGSSGSSGNSRSVRWTRAMLPTARRRRSSSAGSS